MYTTPLLLIPLIFKHKKGDHNFTAHLIFKIVSLKSQVYAAHFLPS